MQEKYKNIIIKIIEKYLSGAKIILFGSRARGDAKEGADIDVAIDNAHTIDGNILNAIRLDLDESELPISFDIVDYYAVPKKLQQSIIKDGVIWKS